MHACNLHAMLIIKMHAYVIYMKLMIIYQACMHVQFNSDNNFIGTDYIKLARDALQFVQSY